MVVSSGGVTVHKNLLFIYIIMCVIVRLEVGISNRRHVGAFFVATRIFISDNLCR